MKDKKYIIDNVELIKDWNYEENNRLGYYPDKITCGSHIKVSWKCHECNNIWIAPPHDRYRKDGRGNGCPKCGRKKLSLYHSTPVVGVNDLESQHPEVLIEWNYERNGDLKPNQFLKKSSYKVWWKCSICGNDYFAEIRGKVNRGLGCPDCSNKRTGDINATPVVGVNDLKTMYPKLLEEWDYERNENLPESYLAKSNKKVYWKCKYGHQWEASIVNRVKGRNCPICKKEYKVSYPEKAIFYYISQNFKDTIENFKLENNDGKELDIYIPSIKTAIEYDGFIWHKNIKRDIDKDKICDELGIKLIRVREKGLPELKSSAIIFEVLPSKDNIEDLERCIQDILNYLNCENKNIKLERDNDKILDLMQLSRKKNSLLELMPEIVNMWDKEKNGNLTPDMFTKGSEKFIWLICTECGKSYCSKVKDVYKKNTTKCTQCSYYRLKKGKNDFKTLYPELAEEYDYEKNSIKFEDLNLGERKHSFFWKCSKCGYQWKASIESRIRSKYCPKCASSVGAKTRSLNLIKKEGSLATNYPELAKEWHPTKNGDLKPEEMTCKNKKIVWWKCSICGNEWENSVALRTQGFGRCKKCNHHLIKN